ncbi:MAG: MATE family efflux transporter [Eubacteriales bacterium]|nr:MATE family efflux transporter [Eubacteriales bacterium]
MKKLKLFNVAWPIFVETALFMTLGFVDVFILSSYNDLAASAVNTANQSVSIVTIVFTVISGASAVLISQYLGAKKKESASRIAAISILFNLIFGIIISVLLVIFSGDILSFIGAEGELLTLAGDYLSIVGGCLFFQALLSSMAVIVRNHGLTSISMFVTVGMNIINTGLDILLVPKMGVTGVALATSFSRILGTIVLAIILFVKIENIKIFKLLKPFPFKDIKDIIKVGVPSALETFLYNVSQLVITSMVLVYLSESELIAKTYVQNITMFFYIFAVSIGQASQIITGHLVGANKMDEAYKGGLKAYRNALIITAVSCVLGVFFREPLISIFSDNPEVIELGTGLLLLNCALEFGRTSNLVLIATLRGAGDVYFPTSCAIFSMWAVSVFGSYLFAVVFEMGIYGLWIALAADEILRGVLMFIRFKGGKWKTKRIVKN